MHQIRGLINPLIKISGLLLIFTPSLIAAQNIALPEALQRALKQNPAIRAVRDQEKAADYTVRESYSGHLPKISVSGAYTYFEKPNIVFPIHQQGIFPPLDDRIFESSAQLTLPLFSGGKTMAVIQAAKAGRENAEARRKARESELLNHISHIFLNGSELKDRRQLIMARLDILYQRLVEMDALSREGRISSADRAFILSAIASARADSMNLASAWQETGWRLGHLLGMQKAVFPELAGLNMETMPPFHLPEAMPDAWLDRNRVVLQADARLRQAEALEKLNKRKFLPDLSGFAAYYYRSGGSQWDPDGEWAAGLRLSFSLFDGGKRLAGWQASKASLRASEQSLQATIQNEYSLLQIAREQWRSARRQRQYMNDAVSCKQEFVESQQAAYKAGRLSLSELMTQETELLQIQIQEKAQLYAERKSALNYYENAGSLTEDIVYKLLWRNNE